VVAATRDRPRRQSEKGLCVMSKPAVEADGLRKAFRLKLADQVMIISAGLADPAAHPTGAGARHR
jgi:hypothetical protein